MFSFGLTAMRLQNFSFDRRQRAPSRFQIMNNRSRSDLFHRFVILWPLLVAGVRLCRASNFHATPSAVASSAGEKKRERTKGSQSATMQHACSHRYIQRRRKEIRETLPLLFNLWFDLYIFYFSICSLRSPESPNIMCAAIDFGFVHFISAPRRRAFIFIVTKIE